ncbi:MAG: CDC48 family AAA ATPase [Myxococcaceae bacterium]
MSVETTERTLTLRVAEAPGKDQGRGLARLDPADMPRLGVRIGDILSVSGKRRTVAKVMPAYAEARGRGIVQIDGVTRANAGVQLDEPVKLSPAPVRRAEQLVLAPLEFTLTQRDMAYIGTLLDGLPVLAGDRVRALLFGSRSADFRVVRTLPSGVVVITPNTTLRIERGQPGQEKEKPEQRHAVSYEDVGGLKRELGRIREIVELPLRYPEVFERLGIDAPKGVLLYGPPGCGKTLIARAVANETAAAFFTITGPEIMHKFYGESEAHLRQIFEEAQRQAPAIIFVDEIDAIAPRRENAQGEVEKRVVAQLLSLMDGLAERRHVIVLAATNIPNVLDPALRRPGRFDREIAISIPDRTARQEILAIHSRGMPLAQDVVLDQLAAVTHGYVGADLQALCREAAMICLRRLIPRIDFATAQIPYDELMKLEVTMADFQTALHEVGPSAIREVFVETPDVRWQDVGGLGQVKQRLIEAVEWPLTHTDVFTRARVHPPKGVLLSGPPGCGKTLMAKAAARETQVNFISVKGPALLSKFVGESEKAVREIFQKARQAAPCILFFDEIDSLVPTRSSGGLDERVSERVVSQFLAEMDGIEELNGVLVLAATNRPDMLDPAMVRPGRFDLLVQVPLPDQQGRREIFQVHLRGKPVAEGLDLDALAAATESFSGADIQAVCNQAAWSAVRQVICGQGEDLIITTERLFEAIQAQKKERLA